MDPMTTVTVLPNLPALPTLPQDIEITSADTTHITDIGAPEAESDRQILPNFENHQDNDTLPKINPQKDIAGIKHPLDNSEWVNLLFNVTINDISVIYVTAHRYAGGLKKKLDLRSGSQRHRHFVGFFDVPVQAPTRDHPFYTVMPTHRPI